MEISDFIIFISPVIALEVLAAIAGSYYLKTAEMPFKNSKYLVYFLWFTVFVELIGSYAPIAYFSNYKYFSFIKGTPFEFNYWWFNIFIMLNFAFFTYYFVSFLRNKTVKSIGHFFIALYLIVSISIYAFSNNIFKVTSNFVIIMGTLFLLLSVLFFYFELLRSDLLLQLKRFLPFYISVGVLVFNLTVTPVDILADYFSGGEENELFIKLHVNLLLYANIFLYSSFILGFLICSKTKKFS